MIHCYREENRSENAASKMIRVPDETKLTPAQKKMIDDLMTFYEASKFPGYFLDIIAALFETSDELKSLWHSTRKRRKSNSSMRGKLVDKLVADPDGFDLTQNNFFKKITDSAGFRILHLHTLQFPRIHEILLELFKQADYPLLEKPHAKYFDFEYKEMFDDIGLVTKPVSSLYTSVHYIIGLKAEVVCSAEIQVRTLAEELWGEVDHTVNYPVPAPEVYSRECIRALAKSTASCTRLVDAIFRSRGYPAGHAGSLTSPAPTIIVKPRRKARQA